MKKYIFITFLLSIVILSSCSSNEKTIREQNKKIAVEAYEEYENGADYWDSVKANIQPLDEDSVYWVPNGKSYHATRDCVALLNSSTIINGTLQEAFEKSKTDPCSKCVGD